jgi:nuclear pore complex protein Nup54
MCSVFCKLVIFSRTEVVIYVVERSPNGTSRRVPATTLHAHFEQANIKTQLQQLGVTLSMTRTELSPAQIKQLLQNPPAGMFLESRVIA